MSPAYAGWTKARLSAALRARGLADRGATHQLRARLRAADEGREAPVGTDGDAGRDDHTARAPDGTPAPGGPPPAAVVPERMLAEIRTITGRDVERVSGLQAVDGWWRATVELIGLARVPRSQDVLHSYRVEFDREGAVRSCGRTAVFVRGRHDRPGRRT